jgi:hypothetical protein
MTTTRVFDDAALSRHPKFSIACECMAEAIYKLGKSLPTYGIQIDEFAKSKKQFTVSPAIMKHLNTVFRKELYYPNRDLTKTLPKMDPTFMGVPIRVDPVAHHTIFGIDIITLDTRVQDRTLRISQSIPFYYNITEAMGFGGLTVIVKSRAQLPIGFMPNELTALSTLREMISETDYRKYIKYGFILCKTQSGKTYQIFRGDRRISIWDKGIKIEELCVRLADSSIPPTDKVIALKTMIEISEEEVRKLSNVYPMIKKAA